MSLAGKKAVVTGATSGIGYGIALRLAKAGCDLFVTGAPSEEAIDGVLSQIEAQGNASVSYRAVDFGDLNAVEQFGTSLGADFGPVDILVNNAGIQYVSPIEDFPLEKWQAILAINLSAPFVLIKQLLPEMKERSFGRVINIASVHGLLASVHKTAYVSAKHGLVGLTKAVAVEAAGSGVTCNAICPGFVKTPLVEAQLPALAERLGVGAQEAEDALLHRQPLRQFVPVEDIAELVFYLCSDAARTMTGTAIPIDGAWTAT